MVQYKCQNKKVGLKDKPTCGRCNGPNNAVRERNAFTETSEEIVETGSASKQRLDSTNTLKESVHDRERDVDREHTRERDSRLDG